VRLAVALALASAPAIPTTPAHAGQATCSNPGLPAGAVGSSDLIPWRLNIGLTAGMLPIASEQLLDEPTGQVRYDARVVIVENRLTAELAVTPWLALGMSLPYRIVSTDVTYRDPATGEEIMPQSATIHARDETVHGIGDPAISGHVAREVGAWRLHVRAGATLPLGKTEPDPFALGDIGQEHQHVQFGSGTIVPFVAVEAQHPIGPVGATAWAVTYQSLYENGEGYRAGDRYSAGVSGSIAVGARKQWTINAGVEAHGETAETWQGVVHEDEGNAGRIDAMIGGGAAWRPRPDLAIVADLKLPLYSEVVGTQLDYPIVASIGITGSFDLKRAPSYRGADMGVVGPAGSDTPLVPVAGRITVFDLWASWCAPCRDLDDRLAALARAHPDRIAIRKLDVVDGDSAAWARYIEPGGFALPHVKVYDASGKLAFERSAPPAELVRAIEALMGTGTTSSLPGVPK
jgi:thiol-disulfide isomerase/thioredoxin